MGAGRGRPLAGWWRLVLNVAGVAGLGAVAAVVELAPGARRRLQPEELWTVAYPHAARETVPPVWLPVLGLFLPLAVYAADYALRTRRAADLGAACLGQFLAFLTTGIATDLVKLAVGRPRPDFLARCFPHGVPAEVPLEDGFPACEEPGAPGVKDGYKSFPSGHASLAFASLGFLSLYLVHSFRLRRGAGRPWRRLAATLPWLGALMVGVSRVHDYRHNPSDVLAGAALGTFTAVTVARQTFAPPPPRARPPAAKGAGEAGEPMLDLEAGMAGVAGGGEAP